ncbi:hypothetical protein TVAG_276190 [Trichomonas vaginalis G3]|uniref:Uncharacterized protein n=1 Tax=Trichomonas vaginalis (strain ATCC PRA-98 / G3) TaxID=412133 RepID=A2ECQ0_TRIV3|nr:myosin rod-like family protein [Trichomonas vaginalis G3]EAY09546.1 hypothetical protein TVAG_276190 [Trichomonas vaginalis G3]KAI5533173.1 myosin rod-like family protein [Trichomonas vaginalis G3]|eukprot:XP_001321769.1 hypothetical protein [Trichomonas vaginalis G3]
MRRENKQTNIKDLWNKMTTLRHLIIDDEIEPNQAIQEVFDRAGKAVPEWLNDELVFSPISKCFDEDLQKQIDKNKILQRKLSDLLEQRNMATRQSFRSSKNDPKTLEDLKKEIQALELENQQLLSFQSTMIMGSNNSLAQKLSDLDDDVNAHAVQLNDLRNEIAKINEVKQECIRSYNDQKAAHTSNLQELDSLTEETKKYRITIKQLASFKMQIQKMCNTLSQRCNQTEAFIQGLEQAKQTNSKQLAKLQDSYNEHQQLVQSYENIEDKIKKQEQQQDVVLNKMIESVELCEEASAEAQKAKMTRDMYSEELARIKSVVSSTQEKFNQAIDEQESQMKVRFESALSTIASRIKLIESENQQLSSNKEAISKQISAANQENSILKATKSDNGFSSFVETISGLKAEIDACFTKKEQLAAQIESSKQNIESFKDKENQVRTFLKSDQGLLLQKRQYLEMELEMQKSLLKDTLAKNAKLTSDNISLTNQIQEQHASVEQSVNNELKGHQAQITELQVQIDEVTKANESAISDFEKQILMQKQLADKWKAGAMQVTTEADMDHEQLENNLEVMQDKIEDLLAAIVEKKQAAARYKSLIDQLSTETSTIKQTLDMKEKKSRRNATEIEDRTTKQMDLINMRSKYRDTSEKLDLMIAQKKRELAKIQKQTDNLGETESEL